MIIEIEGIKLKLHPEVYEPAEDSILLLKNLVDVKNKDVLEIGVGTGLISIACAKKGAKKIVGVDINPYAVKLAKENAKLNNVNISFLRVIYLKMLLESLMLYYLTLPIYQHLKMKNRQLSKFCI